MHDAGSLGRDGEGQAVSGGHGFSTPYPDGFVPDWAKALEVWGRFSESYPGYRCGTWVDPVHGPSWVDHRGDSKVYVRTQDWWAEPRHDWVVFAHEQMSLGLLNEGEGT